VFRRVEVVRQFLRRPRIPDDGGVGTGFLNADHASKFLIVDFHGSGVIGINAVGFLCDAQRSVAGRLPRAVGAGGEVVEQHVLQTIE